MCNTNPDTASMTWPWISGLKRDPSNRINSLQDHPLTYPTMVFSLLSAWRLQTNVTTVRDHMKPAQVSIFCIVILQAMGSLLLSLPEITVTHWQNTHTLNLFSESSLHFLPHLKLVACKEAVLCSSLSWSLLSPKPASHWIQGWGTSLPCSLLLLLQLFSLKNTYLWIWCLWTIPSCCTYLPIPMAVPLSFWRF